jgi:hypothetical protein
VRRRCSTDTGRIRFGSGEAFESHAITGGLCGRQAGTKGPDAHPNPDTGRKWRRSLMLKFLGSAAGIIFIIGLLVVFGLLALIF